MILDLAALAELTHHFGQFGECYLSEMTLAANRWIPLLADTGWVTVADGDAVVASPTLLHLCITVSETDCLRYICFSIPAYRRYLLMVLAEGLTRAARIGYEELEGWLFRDLGALAAELNGLLDEIEHAKARIVTWPESDVDDYFDLWHAVQTLPSVWDQDLLTMSVTHEQAFNVVLGRIRYFSPPIPIKTDSKPVTLLPTFEVSFDGTDLLSFPPRAAWCTERMFVHSSIPFYDGYGNVRADTQLPVDILWQDALAAHPYYRATLRLAIAAHLSGYTSTPITLAIPHDAPGIGHTTMFRQSQQHVSLAEIYPELLNAMGYFTLQPISPATIDLILRQWTQTGAVQTTHGKVVLTDAYLHSLYEPRRGKELMRGAGKDEQERVKHLLDEVLRD